MAEYKHISPNEITDNTFKLISKDWMLITSSEKEGSLVCGKDYNTMTASWGGLGFIWNKPVAFIFVRPQRHTFAYTENNSELTLSFFDETYRSALNLCGTKSGRDMDKAKESGITPVCENTENGRVVWFDEARMVLKCKIMYKNMLEKDNFTVSDADRFYSADDYHMMYVCEITDVMVK